MDSNETKHKLFIDTPDTVDVNDGYLQSIPVSIYSSRIAIDAVTDPMLTRELSKTIIRMAWGLQYFGWSLASMVYEQSCLYVLNDILNLIHWPYDPLQTYPISAKNRTIPSILRELE